MKYHTITFTIPEAATAFIQKAQGIRQMVGMNGVKGKTVHMQSEDQLAPAQIRLIKAEAAINFGMLSTSSFNLSASPVPLCGDCSRVLADDEIEQGFCDPCLESAVGE